MPARPGGTAIGILKPAEPLEGSTCTELDCTLEEIPAAPDADVESDDLGTLGAGFAAFGSLLLTEALVEDDAEVVDLLSVEELAANTVPVEDVSALMFSTPKTTKIRLKNNRVLVCLNMFFLL